MKNKLPKSWAVKNDGSLLFKNTVIKYINDKAGFKRAGSGFWYYGIDSNGKAFDCGINKADTILTLEEFINLTKEETMTVEQLEQQLKSIQAEIDKLKQPKFEVGKWYKSKDANFRVVCFRELGDKNYGYCSTIGWHNDFGMSETRFWTPATDKEVEEALIKEAEKRGFKEGVKTNGIYSEKEISIINKLGFVYKENELRVCVDGEFYKQRLIFKDGKWAEIVKEEPIMIGGYEVKIEKALSSNNIPCIYTTIDGNTFTKEFWEAAKVISEHSKAKIMVGCSKQFDVSLEVINKILIN